MVDGVTQWKTIQQAVRKGSSSPQNFVIEWPETWTKKMQYIGLATEAALHSLSKQSTLLKISKNNELAEKDKH